MEDQRPPAEEEEEEEDGEEEAEALLSKLFSSLGSSSSILLLNRLIHLSRFHPTRSSLASLNAVPRLLSHLPQLLLPSPSLSPFRLTLLSLLLKLLRNLCAGEAPNQLAFLDCNGVELVASLFRQLLEISGHADTGFDLSDNRPREQLETTSPEDVSQIRSRIVNVFQMALQLLGNVCGGGEAQKETVWNTFVPVLSRRIALTGEEKILEPLCMVIYTCSNGKILRLTDLCRGEGAALISACLRTATHRSKSVSIDESSAPDLSNEGVNDWLYLLVSQLCLRESLFPALFANLLVSGAPLCEGNSHGAEPIFCPEQVVLLVVLCSLLSEKQEPWSRGFFSETQDDNILPMPSVSVAFLTEITRTASKLSDPGCPYLKLPCGISSIDILGYSLEIMRILSAWECDGRTDSEWPPSPDKTNGESTRSSILSELLSHGCIHLCLELLHDLGPPELICRAVKKDGKLDLASGLTVDSASGCQNSEMHRDTTLGTGEGQELDRVNFNLAAEVTVMKATTLFYQGYRRDLVAVIGNASYQSRSVQDEVGKLGGMSLILQQCVVDTENPFLREWGLWAIRNLVEHNEKNTREILDMQLKGSFTPLELTQMGMKVTMDPVLGRPKLVVASP